MTWSLRLTASARGDVAQALGWTLDRFGEAKHAEYLDLIGLALQTIATEPAGPAAKERPELYPNARTLHIARRGKAARHFFLYRINNDGSIDVARFLHDAMELAQHLPSGFERDA